jgi:hypothetical protein
MSAAPGATLGAATLPLPLTPADCDLRTMPYMPFFGQRMRDSAFYALATDAEFRAYVSLLWSAWTQVPAGSLPADEVALCRLADLGRDIATWNAVRGRALHGFILCSDGRLYHPLLCEHAIAAWSARKAERERKAAWRAKAAGKKDDVPRTETGTPTGRDADVPSLSEAKRSVSATHLREAALRSSREGDGTSGLKVPISRHPRATTKVRKQKANSRLSKKESDAFLDSVAGRGWQTNRELVQQRGVELGMGRWVAGYGSDFSDHVSAVIKEHTAAKQRSGEKAGGHGREHA